MMSEMQTLEGQLDDFAGVPEEDTAPEKPSRKLRKPRSKHVRAFETGVPLPGEEPPRSLPSAPHVYAAISAVTAGLAQTGIAKDRPNMQQGYKFRGIDDVYNALSRLLVKHGLVILPRVEDRAVSERQARGGGVLNYVTIKMTFDLVSSVDGSREQVSSYGEAMDSGDKATNKALSTAYKYMAMQVFCIPTIGLDPEEDTYEVVSSAARATRNSTEQQPTAANSTEQQLPPREPTSGPDEVEPLTRTEWLESAERKAIQGSMKLKDWWENSLSKTHRQMLEPDLKRLKAMAEKADKPLKELTALMRAEIGKAHP